MNKKELSIIYDELYDLADRIIKKYNPCELSKNRCLDGKFCCEGCKYLSKDGCTTKALFCKVWLCKNARRKYPYVARLLECIKTLANEYHLLLFRESKENSIEYALRYTFQEEIDNKNTI
jgi:hypothetical protein